MSESIRRVALVGAWLLLAAVASEHAAALGMEAFGPAGEHIGRSPDWAKGVEDVLRHRSRVYWCDVNGGERAYYDGDIETVNELLDLYSRVDLAEHAVVLRPGRPAAKSFDGKLIPYVVEFEVPGGIYLHHVKQYAGTGLYSLTPRMIIHLDAALIEHLEELKVPVNVTLHEFAVRVEDALAHANDQDSGLRYRAIEALGEADSSPAILDALNLALKDKNEAIRTAGEAALNQLAAANIPAEQALRKRLSEFIRSHPQHARVPAPEELLTALRHADAEYAKGFTARGTRVEMAPSGVGRLVAWTVTMDKDRLVVDQRDVDDADHPPVQGRFEYVNYAGPDRMGSIQTNRLWVDGKLIEAKPMATFEPVGSTYDLLIGRVLWPLGRGFSRRIGRINDVKQRADSLLTVAAEGGDESLMYRWELVIDPRADYLIRSAKAFRRDDASPSYAVETAGILTGDGRSIAHTARWIEDSPGDAASIAVTSVSATSDAELIKRTEDRLDSLPGLGR